METAKLFQSGNSQAVRLPKEYRFPGDRVYLKRVGNAVILLPYGAAWEPLVESLSQFTDDFLETRAQLPAEQRERAFE